MEKIKIHYYKLKEEKEMGDGQSIPKDQDLILLKEDDDGLLFFETTDNDEFKKLFWTNKNEVILINSSDVELSDEKINERNSYINGEFL